MSKNLQLSIKINAQTGELEGSLKKAEKELGNFAHQSGAAGAVSNKAFSKTRAGIESISKQLHRIQSIAAGAFVFAGINDGVHSLVQMSDAYTTTTARLHLATNSTKEYTTAYSELVKITRNSYGDFGATVDLYSSMSRATQDLGLKQSTLLTVTDAVNKAIVVSGASSVSAEAALVQLGQALSSGTLRGEELNSILEQTPRIARMIADGSGIAFGQLRAVAAQGGLTSEVVIRALQKEAATVNKEFNSIPPTISGAAKQVHNSMLQIWGDFTTTSGSANGLANSILFVADNLRSMVDVGVSAVKIIAAAYLAKGVTSVSAYIATQYKSIAATKAAQAAEIQAAETAVASARRKVLAAKAYTGANQRATAAALELAAAEKALAAATAAGNTTLMSRIGLSNKGTRASLAGLGKVNVASQLLFAAWAGWEIGTYLSDRFAIVKQAGIAMAGGLSKVGENIYAAFKLAWAKTEISFSNMVANIKIFTGDMISGISKALSLIPGMETKASGMQQFAKSLQETKGAAESVAAATKRINAERDKNIKANEAFYALSFAEAGQTKKAAGKQVSKNLSPHNKPLVNTQKPADGTALIQQMNTAFDDSATRMSSRYVDMWSQLVKTHGEGSKQVRGLEVAYQSWLDGQDAQRIAKEQSAAKQVVDIHGAKFKRMEILGQLADKTEKERIQALLKLKLDALQREQSNIEAATLAQGGNVQAVRDYYNEQRVQAEQDTADKIKAIDEKATQDRLDRMAAGEQAAYDLKGQFQQLVSDNQQVNLTTMADNFKSYTDALWQMDQKSGKRQLAWDKFTGTQKLQFAAASMSALSGLMQSHNRKQFDVGKAAAQGQNAINTYLGATKAYQSMAGIPYVGPFLGVAAAAAVVAAGVANAQKINSAKMGGSTGGVSIPSISAGGGGAAPSAIMNSQTGLPMSQAPAPKQAQQVHITIKSDTGFVDPNAMQQVAAHLAPYIADANNSGMNQAMVA